MWDNHVDHNQSETLTVDIRIDAPSAMAITDVW